MKKKTRQQLMAFSILIILSLSSIAYVFYGVTQPQPQSQPQQLTGYIVDGDLDPQLESAYVQNGWTVFRVYRNETLDFTLESFIDQAPGIFTTSQGQTQMIVQKINSTKNYAVVSNLNGDNTIENLTVDDIYLGLCNNLMVLPTECALVGLNLTGY